jgi:hypothetical protein
MTRIEFIKTVLWAVCGLSGSFAGLAPARKPRAWVLNRCWIAGFAYHEGPALRDQLQVGDRLEVRPEFDNPHDKNAVALHHHGRHLGYVPRNENRHIARLLQQGASLESRIVRIHPEHDAWNQVRVEISLLPEAV